MGVDSQTLPPDPIQEEPTYEGALAAFEALEPIRILFDNGAGGDPGKPNPGFEHSFPELPGARGTTARSWYFGDDGALQDDPPEQRGGRLVHVERRSAGPLTDLTEGRARPRARTACGPRRRPTTGCSRPRATRVSYVTEPLSEDTTVIGAGAVHAWVRSSKPTVDLMATITEVRPDGKETFVQSGWVRGEMRKLDQDRRARCSSRC